MLQGQLSKLPELCFGYSKKQQEKKYRVQVWFDSKDVYSRLAELRGALQVEDNEFLLKEKHLMALVSHSALSSVVAAMSPDTGLSAERVMLEVQEVVKLS